MYIYKQMDKPSNNNQEVHMDKLQKDKIQVLEDNIAMLKDKVLDAAADKDYSEMARLGMIITINEKLLQIIKATTGDK